MKRPVLLAITLALFGCDHTEEDCRQVVGVINKGLDEIRAPAVGSAGPVAQERARAAKLGQRGTELAGLQLQTASVAKERDAYVAAVKSAADATEAWAKAVDDRGAARKAGDEAKRGLEKTLAALDAECDGSTCHEVMKRIADASDVGDDKLIAELGDLAGDLLKMPTEVEPVDAAVAAHATQLRNLAQALEKMALAEGEAGAAAANRAKAISKADDVVTNINKICR